MFAKISRGDRMSGLLVYLAGPGRSNEHSEPHLVAGSAGMVEWHDDAELQRDSALHIARNLDRPRRAFGVEVNGGHVWHCSLSLRAEEGQLTDNRWREISEAFVDRMGFGTHEGTKAETRWIAVRHGLSTNGNDHVHLIVNLVREDGTKASVHNERLRARDLCRELENEFGLEPLESADRGRASVPFERGEREAVARRRARGVFEQERRSGAETRTWASVPAGEREQLCAAQLRTDQPRWDLARRVRGCATASVDEAEFVRRLRQHGVLVRPRFADGRDDVVVGYSVASRPVAGERPIWYGGGHLAKDLTLPRLRAEWPDSPHSATAAVGEWTAAKRGRRPVGRGREHTVPDAAMWQQVGRELDQLTAHLKTVPVEDRAAWARVARQSAGAFSAWSTRFEEVPGPLAAAADALARSAETTRAAKPRTPMPSAAGAAYLLLAASKPGVAGQMAMLKALANLARALYDMHRADGARQRATGIYTAVRTHLTVVDQHLVEAAQLAPELATVGAPSDGADGADGGQRTGQGSSTDAPAASRETPLQDPRFDEETLSRAEEARRIATLGQAPPGTRQPTPKLGSPMPNPIPEPTRSPARPILDRGSRDEEGPGR